MVPVHTAEVKRIGASRGIERGDLTQSTQRCAEFAERNVKPTESEQHCIWDWMGVAFRQPKIPPKTSTNSARRGYACVEANAGVGGRGAFYRGGQQDSAEGNGGRRLYEDGAFGGSGTGGQRRGRRAQDS